MELKNVVLIGVFLISNLSSALRASDGWTPSQSVVNRCNVYQAGATWALLGKRGGAGLEHMLSQVDLGRENEPTKEVIRSGVRAAYDSPDQNFYAACLKDFRAGDLTKQAGINSIRGQWMCQVAGSADSTQLWVSYNPESTYSVGSPSKEWRHGSFTVEGDFVIEHLGGNLLWETQRRISRDGNGVLSLNGMPCHTFVSPH